NPSKNAQQQQQTALKTMQDLDALKQKIADNQRLKSNDNRTSKSSSMSTENLAPESPLKDAEQALDHRDNAKAANAIEKVVNDFNHMKAEEKQKAAEDMQKLANKEQQKADQQQKKQEDAKNQLQQMGADKQKLDQLQKQLQAAAQGDQQAAQQAQQ